MFKIFAILLVAVCAVASAKPAPQFVAYNSPLVASAPGAFAPYATAVASRQFHGASPYYSAYSAPLAYSAYSAYPYVF